MTRDEKIIRNKVGVLELAKQLGGVARRAGSWGFPATAFTGLRICTRRAAKRR